MVSTIGQDRDFVLRLVRKPNTAHGLWLGDIPYGLADALNSLVADGLVDVAERTGDSGRTRSYVTEVTDSDDDSAERDGAEIIEARRTDEECYGANPR